MNHNIDVLHYKPDQLLTVQRHDGERVFEVRGNHMGALNQESVVALSCVDGTSPSHEGVKDVYFVPNCILDAAIAGGNATLTTVK